MGLTTFSGLALASALTVPSAAHAATQVRSHYVPPLQVSCGHVVRGGLKMFLLHATHHANLNETAMHDCVNMFDTRMEPPEAQTLTHLAGSEKIMCYVISSVGALPSFVVISWDKSQFILRQIQACGEAMEEVRSEK